MFIFGGQEFASRWDGLLLNSDTLALVAFRSALDDHEKIRRIPRRLMIWGYLFNDYGKDGGKGLVNPWGFIRFPCLKAVCIPWVFAMFPWNHPPPVIGSRSWARLKPYTAPWCNVLPRATCGCWSWWICKTVNKTWWRRNWAELLGRAGLATSIYDDYKMVYIYIIYNYIYIYRWYKSYNIL